MDIVQLFFFIHPSSYSTKKKQLTIDKNELLNKYKRRAGDSKIVYRKYLWGFLIQELSYNYFCRLTCTKGKVDAVYNQYFSHVPY